MLKKLSICSLFSIAGIAVISLSYIFPIAFSGINGTSGNIWLWISNSGGTIGVACISVILSTILALSRKRHVHKLITFISILAMLFVILTSFAKLNEHIIKEQIKINRPYSFFLQENFSFPKDIFYSFETKRERTEYMEAFFEKNSTQINKKVSTEIIEHWITESGFSFPSGHSENAFLLSFLFSYIFIFQTKLNVRYFVAALLTTWAIAVALSRVAVGAHSTNDILTGAGLGLLFGIIIIASTLTERIIPPNKPP